MSEEGFFHPDVSLLENARGEKPKVVKPGAVIASIRGGVYSYRINSIRKAYNSTLAASGVEEVKKAKEAVDRLKKKLPAIQWSGTFSGRGDRCLISYSGLLCADIDHVDEETLLAAYQKATKDNHVFACFRSPTNTGLKMVFRVHGDAQRHRDSFVAVRDHVRAHYGLEIDEACKNVERLCFVSDDPGAFYNNNTVPLAVNADYTESQSDRETESTDVSEVADVTDVTDVMGGLASFCSVAEILPFAIPKKEHTNNRYLFTLARGVLSLERSRGDKFTKAELTDAFSQWHLLATPFLRAGQTREEYWIEFMHARKTAKVGLGEETIHAIWQQAQKSHPAESNQFETPELKLLVSLCYHLQLASGEKPFYLACRTFEQLISRKKCSKTIASWMLYLVDEGVLALVEKGTPNRAARYRFLCNPKN